MVILQLLVNMIKPAEVTEIFITTLALAESNNKFTS